MELLKDIGLIIFVVLTGLFSALSLIDKTKKKKQEDINSQQIIVNNLTNERMNLLEKVIGDNEKIIQKSKLEINRLKIENNKLTEILSNTFESHEQTQMEIYEISKKQDTKLFEIREILSGREDLIQELVELIKKTKGVV